jgi:hypothetical protein
MQGLSEYVIAHFQLQTYMSAISQLIPSFVREPAVAILGEVSFFLFHPELINLFYRNATQSLSMS